MIVLGIFAGGIGATQYVQWKKRLVKTDHCTPLPFLRRPLTRYLQWPIVGNLLKVIEEIEGLLLANAIQNAEMQTNNNCKEDLPFICLINPPRFGKSLLLDKIFADSPNRVRVISITYNNNSNVTASEVQSYKSALYYLYLRIIRAVIGLEYSFSDVSDIIGKFDDNTVYSLSWCKQMIKMKFHRNPFVDDLGQQINLLIGVDEFSKLIDMVSNSWSAQDKKFFVNTLQNDKQAGPFIQYIFTGFTWDLTSLLSVSAVPIRSYSLSLCDYSSAKPLLKEIVGAYKNYHLSVPMDIFEVVKSTPGLVGYWAERVFKDSAFDSGFALFADQMNYAKSINNRDTVFNNWILVKQYMMWSELGIRDHEQAKVLGEKIVSAELGVFSTQYDMVDHRYCISSFQFFLSPFCFRVIIGSSWLKEYLKENVLDDIPLLTFLSTAVEASSYRVGETDGSSHHGKPFEDFVKNAIQARLRLRWMMSGQKPQNLLKVSFHDLFPSDVYGEIHCSERFTTYLYGISSKEKLQSLLTLPLYYLFPVGLENLEEHSSEGQRFYLSKWIRKKLSNNINSNNNNPIPVCAFLDDASSKNLAFVSKSLGEVLKQNPLTTKEETKFKNSFAYDDLTLEREFYLDTLDTNSNKQRFKQIKALHNSLKSMAKQIVESQRSLILPISNDAIGCDLLLKLFGTNENSEINENDVHIVVMELKDSRKTTQEAWDKKFELLLGYRSCIHFLAELYATTNVTVKFHIIMAGREHSHPNDSLSTIVDEFGK